MGGAEWSLEVRGANRGETGLPGFRTGRGQRTSPFIGASSRGTILVPCLPTVPASARQMVINSLWLCEEQLFAPADSPLDRIRRPCSIRIAPIVLRGTSGALA